MIISMWAVSDDLSSPPSPPTTLSPFLIPPSLFLTFPSLVFYFLYVCVYSCQKVLNMWWVLKCRQAEIAPLTIILKCLHNVVFKSKLKNQKPLNTKIVIGKVAQNIWYNLFYLWKVRTNWGALLPAAAFFCFKWHRFGALFNWIDGTTALLIMLCYFEMQRLLFSTLNRKTDFELTFLILFLIIKNTADFHPYLIVDNISLKQHFIY